MGFLLAAFGATPTVAETLRVLKVGLGEGTVFSDVGGITCGSDCDEVYGTGQMVTLTATPASRFAGWSGACTNLSGPCTVTLDNDLAVTALFNLSTPVPPLTDLTPQGIDDYLDANTWIDRPSYFIAALPAEFKESWILMSRSESLQTGTAKMPRILLPSANAEQVFTIGISTSSSYPGAHPYAIEYMQWDGVEKNFRFHEVVLSYIPPLGVFDERFRGVEADDFKCAACHSTGNIRNPTSLPGTTGIVAGLVPPRNKPNWDSYDSWGGMLPFNRDRIYKDSLEAAAFRNIFNLWNWRGSVDNDERRKILEQLVLQPSHSSPPSPHSIVRNLPAVADDDHILFGFDGLPPITSSPLNTLTTVTISYDFGESVAPSPVQQQGRYVTVRHAIPDPPPTNDDYLIPRSDEGRGVQLFDLLGSFDSTLNAQRIADELIDHRWSTGNAPVDVRAIALAIARGCLTISGSTVQSAGSTMLAIDDAFFNDRNGMTIDALVTDTGNRARSFPRRKAEIQRLNLDRTRDLYIEDSDPVPNGLIQEYGPLTSAGTDTSIERIREEIFRRPIDLGSGATEVANEYVDRESYGYNTPRVALFRYFLEPLAVPVDSWSMSVRGRSRTYTFADVFGQYITVLVDDLTTSLDDDPSFTLDPTSCDDLITTVNDQFGMASVVLEEEGDMPHFTNIQRIFNRNCIECHGGLNYPPYSNYNDRLDLSEIDQPGVGETRFSRSHRNASNRASSLADTLYSHIIETDEECPYGMMPCGGPPLSQADIETIGRWIEGGASSTAGDPHLRTIDGIYYDFQAAGEFVLLRGENFELQARHVPVQTAGPLGPDAHTGLTSCVSVTGAVALWMDGHRITYQPDLVGVANPEGLELRIDGVLKPVPGADIVLDSVRISATPASDGIQIQGRSGTKVVITPEYWHHQQIWYMNVDVERGRATEGLIGSVAPGNWLPALSDGNLLGARPAALLDRYDDLYDVFGDSWRVKPSTSLFDYAPGTSTATYDLSGWPNGESPYKCDVPSRPDGLTPPAPQQPIDPGQTQQFCAGLNDPNRQQFCSMDIATTGELGFATLFLETELVMSNAAPGAAPLLTPAKFSENLTEPVKVEWKTVNDPESDPVSYQLCVWPITEDFTFLHCRDIAVDPGAYSAGEKLDGLTPGAAYFWKVLTTDDRGGMAFSETWRFQMDP